MADIELIKPRELPEQANVQATDALMVDNGTIVGKATPEKIVNAGAPVASEAEALAGVNNTKRMTPLRVRQVLDNVNNPAVLRAQAWAESSTPPDPLLPDSKSAKTWASIAEQGTVMVQWSMIAEEGQTVLGNDITTGEPIRAYGGVAQISVNGFGPITPEEYSVDSDGVVTLTAPLAEGDVVSGFTQPRLSNSEAQAVVQGVLQQTGADVAAAQEAAARAEAASVVAQSRTDIVLTTAFGMVGATLDTLTYSTSGIAVGVTVRAGDTNDLYRVLPDDAASYDIIGANGLRVDRVFADGVVPVMAFSDRITVRDNAIDMSTWDWRPAWQAALDWMVRHPEYRKISWPIRGGVSLDPSSPAHTNAYTAGGVALSVKRGNITFGGGGCVFLRAGQGSGKEGSIFGNPHVTALSDVSFDDIEVDGNRDNTSGQISGVLLVGQTRPLITSRFYAHDLSRHGAMMRPNASQSGYGPVDVTYDNPRVERVGGIGLQATRPDGVYLTGRVRDCVDNAWDVYGNEPSNPDGGLARRVFIGDVQVQGALTGGFVESFQDATVRGNYYDCNGLKLNRINSGAKRVGISALFSDIGFDRVGTSYGVSIGNNSGKAVIHGSTFEGKINSVISGSGCVDSIMRSDNTHRDIRQYIWQHERAANSLVRCIIEDQIYDGVISADGWPQLAPPVDHPWFIGSRYQSTVGKMFLIANKTEVLPDFTASKSVLTAPGPWGGAYSLYNVGGDGRTRINTNPDIDVTNRPIVVIAGQAYELSSTGTSGEYYVAMWNGASATHGNYTSVLNSALEVLLKYGGFKSPLYSRHAARETRELQTPSGWSGAYAVFVGSETLISLSGGIVPNGSVAVINGYAYTLYPDEDAGKYIVRRTTPSGSISGDFTAYIPYSIAYIM